MKRWHLPSLMNPYERVSKIVDRAFYHEGSFKYKLPRYYRDRLYRKLCPCDARVWNQKKKCYEDKIVYRYKSANVLSLQMQTEVRSRVLSLYEQRVAEFTAQFPHKSRAEIDVLISRSEESMRMDRQKNLYRKLSEFYNTKRFKHRKL